MLRKYASTDEHVEKQLRLHLLVSPPGTPTLPWNHLRFKLPHYYDCRASQGDSVKLVSGSFFLPCLAHSSTSLLSQGSHIG